MPNPRTKYLLALCFLVSGATSLVLEVAWAQELSYVLGTSLYAVSTVVGAFMAGLAFGAFLASRYFTNLRRPVLAYALLQFAIAVCGFTSISVFRATPAVFGGLYTSDLDPALFFAMRFAVVFLLMLGPCTLMGMTLPLVAGAFSRAKQHYDFETGLVYGINTLGAVLGTVFAGFVLIPAVGLWMACALVGVTDAAVGLVALALSAALGPIDADAEPAAPAPRRSLASLLRREEVVGYLYLLSGMAAIALEVTWFRFLAYAFGPTANAFSVMLATFLTGVALGSGLGAPLARRTRDPSFEVARLQFLLAAIVLSTTALYNELPSAYGGLYFELSQWLGFDASPIAQGLTAALVVLPPTLVMGALFPVTLRCYREALGLGVHAEHTVGRLYALNTVGGILGSFAAGFWILPRLGIFETAIAAGGVTLLIGAAFVVMSPRPLPTRAGLVAAALAVCVTLGVAIPRIDLLAMNRGSFMALSNPLGFRQMMGKRYNASRRMLFYREGVHASVAVTSAQGNLYLRVSGRPVADTTMPGRAHLALLGQLPTTFARDPKKVAVVGFGVGMSTGAALTHPGIEQVDVLELEPAVVEASRYFAYLNGDALNDARTSIYLDDGRTTLTYRDEVYDVITSDALSPLAAGAANLYTTDYFQLVSNRLADDGVFCQWIETFIPSEQTFKGILASIRAVFPHVVLFKWGPDVVLLGAKQPIVLPWETLVERMSVDSVRHGYELLGVDTPADLLTLYLADTADVDAYLGAGQRRNTDDDNWLTRQMPYDLNRKLRRDLPSVLAREFAESRVRGLMELVPGLPVDAMIRATVLPEHPMMALHAAVLAGGLEAYYRSQGDAERVKTIRSLRRRGGDSDGSALPTRDGYRALVTTAEQALADGDTAAALAALDRIVEYPNQPYYYEGGLKRAETLAAVGRHEEALQAVRMLELNFPAFPTAFAQEVRLLRKLGREEQARTVLERGLFYNPTAPGLLKLRAG